MSYLASFAAGFARTSGVAKICSRMLSLQGWLYRYASYNNTVLICGIPLEQLVARGTFFQFFPLPWQRHFGMETRNVLQHIPLRACCPVSIGIERGPLPLLVPSPKRFMALGASTILLAGGRSCPYLPAPDFENLTYIIACNMIPVKDLSFCLRCESSRSAALPEITPHLRWM